MSALELARKLVEELEKQEKAEKVELATLEPGETFKIGEHDFIVLEQIKEQTAVISKDLMLENIKFDENTKDYGKSNLKKVIEEQIQPIIEKEVGAENIVSHEVDLTSVDNQYEFQPVADCKVRPLTFDEVRNYSDFMPSKNLNDWWWTCTPWSTSDRGYKYLIAVVSSSGYVYYDYCDGLFGVRPFCILKSNIFVSKGEK